MDRVSEKPEIREFSPHQQKEFIENDFDNMLRRQYNMRMEAIEEARNGESTTPIGKIFIRKSITRTPIDENDLHYSKT